MDTYLSVTPGIDMSQALAGQPVTKDWLRDYLRDHPEKDFRNHTGRGAYVNGGDVVRYDIAGLRVHDPVSGIFVATVHFQTTDANQWGYQAVVS